MVHKPKHKVHGFRGILGDGGQDEIELERQNANVAYRIIKLQIMPEKVGMVTQESLLQVWRESQTSIPTSSATITFTDGDLLAAAVGMYGGISGGTVAFEDIVIFDSTLFSRNIYVTHTDNESSESVNYYLELEEVPISASALIQLKLGTARRIKTKQSMG